MSNCACHHAHSTYSVLDGWSTVDELINQTVRLGYPSLTVTDHGNVTSHLELGSKCEKAGINPIFGIEAYHGILTEFKGSQRDQAHLILGAYNDVGLKNLWRLSDKAATNFRFVPRVTWDMLKEFREGLWATSACVQSLVCQGIKESNKSALDQYLNIFGEDFFIEIHTYPIEDQKILNQELVRVAREKGIPLLWSSDAHYADKASYLDHDTYLCMQMGDQIDTPIEERKMWHPEALYIKSEEEIREDLSYLDEKIINECIQNSYDLSLRCNARLPEVRRHLPVFIPSESKLVPEDYHQEGLSSAELLQYLVAQGAYERYGEPSEEVIERLRMETQILLDAGLEDYILQVWEIAAFCDKEGIIRGPGRGSSAGSLVCYVLRITDIDALKYGLYFERFYNIGREKGLPDIDLDFSVSARQKVKEFIINRWGQSNVENIGTTMRLKPIAALNKTWVTFGIDGDEFGTIRKIVGKTPDIDILGADSIGWKDHGDNKTIYVWDHMGDEIDQFIQTKPKGRQEKIYRWLDFVDRLVGRVSGYGIHASGVVISDIPINEELPRMWSASSKTFATQFPMDDVGKRMFLKDDLLGIRNLDTLEDWQEQMEDRVRIFWSGQENIPQPDEMWEMLEHGLGTGIFQIEDRSFPLELCKRIKPRNIEDLALIGALNRPGPIRAGSHERYIRRRNGEEDVVYDDPILEDILAPTLGEFIFQEDVIALFGKLGYTLQEADAVRSILGKKDPEAAQRVYKGQKEWKGRGFLDMAKKAGMGNAQLIWNKVEGFSKYSFNKAHAISYAIIGFRTLFAKYWAPKEFILACIRTNSDDMAKYIAEARRLGIVIHPPHINKSQTSIGISDGDIYLGFSEIKGLSKSSSDYLIELRDNTRRFQTGEILLLRKIFETPDELIEVIEKENEKWGIQDPSTRYRVSPKTRLKSSQIKLLEEVGAFDEYIDRGITEAERRTIEKRLLGIVVSDQSSVIFARHHEKIDQCDSYLFLDEYDQSTIPVMIADVRETKTKDAQEQMAIITGEYGEHIVRFAVFPRQYKSHRHLFSESNCAIITIKRTDRGFHFVEGSKLT